MATRLVSRRSLRRARPLLAAVAAALAVTVAAGAPRPAAAGGLDLSFQVDVVSAYVWRGILFDDGPSLQPSVTGGYALSEATSVGLEAWWNVALEDHGSESWKELLFEQDFVLSASRRLSEAWSLSAGYAYYSNPRSDVEPGDVSWQTDELFVGVDWTGEWFSASASVFRDVGEVVGWYAELGAAVSVPLAPSLTLELGGQVGFAHGMAPEPGCPDSPYWFSNDGLVDSLVSVGLSWELGGHLSAGVAASHAARFDAPAGEDDRVTVLGASLGVSL